MKKFRIIDPKDGSNVLGGDVTENNAHLTINMSECRDKYRMLNIGESITCRFHCSGSTGYYKVLRVE
jgi:hypothetical protein